MGWAKPVPAGYALSMDGRLLEPSASPYSVFGVQSSRLMPHLHLYGQVMTDYAKGLLLARRFDTGAVVSQPLAHRLTSEFALGVGLFSWVEVALSLPVYWFQQSQRFPFAFSGSQATYPEGEESLEAMGIGDLRLWVKVRILENAQAAGFGMALLLEGSLPTGGAFLMRQASATFTPRLVMDYRWKGGFLLSLNAGFRLRAGAPTAEDQASSPSTVTDALMGFRVGNALRLALGTEIPLMMQGLSLIGEAGMEIGFPDGEEVGRVQRVGMELLAGLRWRHHSGVILTAGAGAGLTSGYGVPDFRFFLQIAWGKSLTEAKPSASWAAYEPEVFSPTVKKPLEVKKTPQPLPNQEAAMPEKPAILANRPLSPEAFDQAAKQEQDRDGDGIPDALDQCPDQPETFNGYKDEDGCPDEIPKPVVFKESKLIESTATQIKLKEKVYFRTGSDRLEPRSFPILRVLAQFLKAKQDIEEVMIEGHTDNRGDREQNVDLSERRARRVKSFLVQEGVAVGRLRAKGYGPKKPIATNKTTQGRAENRRVQFLILRIRKATSSRHRTDALGLLDTATASPKKKGGC